MYNRSEATVRSYRETKNHLFKLIPGIDEKEISVLNKQWIGEYTRLLRDSGISVASINHYLRNIRAFVYWCIENDYLVPYKVKLLTETETVKTAYSNDELRVLLRKPSVCESFCTWRTWAIINLILSIGSRASTVVNILKEDLDFKQNRIMTRHNKNRRIKTYPISAELKGVLVEYMRHFVCEETPYLFRVPAAASSLSVVYNVPCTNITERAVSPNVLFTYSGIHSGNSGLSKGEVYTNSKTSLIIRTSGQRSVI